MSIIKIENFKPHLTIQGKNSIHVMPLGLFWDIVERKKNISEIEDINDFLPEIIKEWLFHVKVI